MTKLTKKDVLHVASLSNLKLTEKEIKKLLPQLSKIVEFIGNLSEIDTSEIKSTNQITELINVYRDDFENVGQNLKESEVFQNAEDNNSLFEVPAILEGRT